MWGDFKPLYASGGQFHKEMDPLTLTLTLIGGQFHKEMDPDEFKKHQETPEEAFLHRMAISQVKIS